jgi:DNA-binding MarR family transcriptional regulator
MNRFEAGQAGRRYLTCRETKVSQTAHRERAMTDNEADNSGRQLMQLGVLRESLPFLTRALRAHIRSENSAFFAEFDAMQGEIVVLCLIGENPGASQNDIASTLVFKKSAVTKLIKSLEDRGLVRRDKVAADKRYNALTLTAAGRAKQKRILKRMAEQHAALVAPFSPAEQKQMFDLLNRLLAHLADRSTLRFGEQGRPVEDNASGDD